MTFYCNGEPIARADDVELEGFDIANAKVWKDETFTAEVDTSGWSKEQWYTLLGLIPIIRCKNCKHADWYRLNGKDLCYCNDNGMDGYTENDFCSHAEREENVTG